MTLLSRCSPPTQRVRAVVKPGLRMEQKGPVAGSGAYNEGARRAGLQEREAGTCGQCAPTWKERRDTQVV